MLRVRPRHLAEGRHNDIARFGAAAHDRAGVLFAVLMALADLGVLPVLY